MQIGHVFRSIAQFPVPMDFPFESNMAGKLEGKSQLLPFEIVTAYIGRANPQIQPYRKFPVGENQGQTEACDKCVVTVLQVTCGKLEPGLQMPARTEPPIDRQIPIGIQLIFQEQVFPYAGGESGVDAYGKSARAIGLLCPRTNALEKNEN